MKPKSTFRHILSIASSAVLTISYAHAATLYYDGGTVDIAGNGNSVASGLTGDWNTALLNWDDGPVPYVGWNNSNNDTAFFHMGTAIPGPTPGTVSLTGDITAGGLIFNASGYTISTGANSLTLGGTNNTVALNNSVTSAIINGALAASSANMTFTAQNPATNHTLTFNGISANGWSGTTTVNAGLTLATTSTSGNINQALNSTSGVTLSGGAIQFNRATNAALNAISDSAAIAVYGGGTFGATSADAGGVSALETIGAVTVHSGQMNFNWTNGASSGAQMILSDLTRAGSTSAVTFSGNLGSTGRWKVTGAGTTTVGEILGTWATTGAANGIAAQSDYAVYSSDFVAAAGIAASAESTWSTTLAATSNYTLNNSAVASPANGRLTADRNINTLRNTTLAQNLVASDAATDVITIAGGHSLVDGDVVAIRTITGLANGQAYYVINATGTTLQLSATSGGTAANVTTSGAAGFMTAGLNLNGQTLGTYGILNGSSEPLAIGGGSGSSVTLPTTTSGNLHVTNGNASVWIDAPITDNGAGVLTLVKGGTSGNGSGNVTLSGNNTYTGGTVVNSGNITLSGTNTFATGSAGADVINGGSLTYSTLAAWGGTGRNVTFNGTGTLTSTVVGYSGGALTSNAGANATIVSTNNGAAGSTQISFATTTGAGNVIYSTGNNRLLNLGDASGLTGNLQARLTGNAGYSTATTVQFSSIGDAAGSALQFAGGTSDGNQALTVAYNGTSALTFNNRQVQILDRLTSNWEARDNIIANNSSDVAHTWTINTDLLYTGGRAITAFGGSLQTNRRLILSGSNTGDNAFNGVISDGQNTNGLLLEKAGSGKWIVSGNNTFTGSVTVSAGTLVLSGANDYTGATSVSGGTLVGIVANAFGSTSGISLAAAGTLSLRGDSNTSFVKASDSSPYTVNNSASGATINVDRVTGTGAATMSVGDLTTSSTAGTWGLNFTGANGVSLSAGTLNTPVSTVAGVHTITNTIVGGGTLTLASIFNQATTIASPNLVFAGTGTTIVTGAITQTQADMDLIKNGTGTLLLNGTNTYTGATSVNDGTLGGTGSIAGDVLVAAAGSLAPGASAGTLDIGGGLDISALAGGAGLLNYELGANTAASDQLAVTGTLTIGSGVLGFSDFVFGNLGWQNGTYVLITSGGISGTLDAANSGSIGVGGTGTLQLNGNNLELVVTGLGGGPGPLDHFAISAIGSLQTVGTPIAGITLTAQDASNATVTSFTGTVNFGGTGGFTGTSATFTGGVLSGVSVIPTNAGSGLTFTVTDIGSGKTGSATITTIQTQYDAWSGGLDFDVDTNGDGVDNGLAFLLGASGPNVSAVNKLPTVTQSGGNLILTFKMLDSASRGTAALSVQHSSDLGIIDVWEAALVPDTDQTVNDVVFDITAGAPLDVQATIPASKAAGAKLFGRLKAVRP